MYLPEDIENRLERVLLSVQKPGRYVGGEFNQVIKRWDAVTTRVALAFPDIYDLGLPNLGLSILYQSLNAREDILAERAYSPWLDMEDVLRREKIPLYSLESKHALVDFDILGISLPYETLYTNAINLLDLAGIPIFSRDRSSAHPLVIAGGHATFNPEPASAFFDAMVIGEGEEVIFEIVEAHQKWKRSGAGRSELLAALCQIDGVYVPSFYEPVYLPDGRLSETRALSPQAPKAIRKRILARLPEPPTHFIVPSIDVVHNRVAVEIMRGCTRGCRFCHAGMITRPVRERKVEDILKAIDEALANTGFEDVALLSLSSSDYSHIFELVDQIGQKYADKRLSISLPSLRIESVAINILEKLRTARSSGFTLAPEAATDRMRAIINKPIATEQVLSVVREIYSRGWRSIKLYFMIGHPSETLEDVHAIADLCKAVLAEGRKTHGRRAEVHAGVATFVPKPHTPFQWAACDTREQIEAKQRILRDETRVQGIKLNWTDPNGSLMESWLSRGDRRLSEVIYLAWQKGAKFDAWQDHENFAIWQESFAELNIDPSFYTHRERALDEVFPWDHVQTGVRKDHLRQEYLNSFTQTTRADCREGCYACGILVTFSKERRENPGELWKCPEISSKAASAMPKAVLE